MTASKTEKAFVIKRMAPSTASYLLVVNKELLLGNFAPLPLAPQIGAIIIIEYRHSGNDRNKIDICSWNPYDGYNPMAFRLAGKATDKELKFSGSFYTCGHIRYKGEPLSHPSIFNDFIGVVEDKRGILDRKYIGKLWAIVMYAETPNPVWELCRVERYMREVSELPLLPYRGIVGAVNQGPDKNVNYITSRDFPHDVRFFSGKTEDGVSTSSLLGHEVIFHGYKEGPLKKFYVLGNVEVIGNDVPKIYESFFSVDLMVEHIGCTDDQGVSLVWSDRWEFITDSFGLFKNREHGVYKVEAIRHYKPNEFPRWKVKKILNIVDSYVVEQKRASTPHSTKPPCHSMKQPSEGTISKRSSPCHSVKQHSGGGTSKRGLCDEEDDSDGKRNDSGVYSEELQDCKSPRRPNGEKCRPITTDRVNGDLGCHSSIDEQAERELHDHMHRCLASIKVRAAMKQANPKLFEDLVKALMHV